LIGSWEMTPHVLIILPSPMIARNWLSTGVATRLGCLNDIAVTVLTGDEADRRLVEAAGLHWRPMVRGRSLRGFTRLRYYLAYFIHQMLVHRFNVIAGFRGFGNRLKQSRRLRWLAFREGLPVSPWFGWPLARSRTVFRWLDRIYHGRLHRYRDVEAVLDETKPTLLVLGHIQNHFTTPYALAAQARGVPILGAVGSWDQPTTKGPLNPGISRYLVPSRSAAEKLARHHAVAAEAVEIVGWPQMDLYQNREMDVPRSEVLAELGLPEQARYVLFGASTKRLGITEPEICVRIARYLSQRAACSLLIRPHPNDQLWRERFAALHRPPQVVVVPPEFDRFDRLARQIRYADIVLSSGGTILLDAVALDTPAIAIAFEHENEPYYDRPARHYDMEHWAEPVACGGLLLAREEREFLDLIAATLTDRTRDAAGRKRLRAAHLDPLDGRCAERVVAAVVRAARAELRPACPVGEEATGASLPELQDALNVMPQ
jgi:CDP-glycerol:poly(glycerophosphate) glycerophosphotransferase